MCIVSFWAVHFTLTVPLFTQKYIKWKLNNSLGSLAKLLMSKMKRATYDIQASRSNNTYACIVFVIEPECLTIVNRAAMGRARFLIYPWFILFFLSVG